MTEEKEIEQEVDRPPYPNWKKGLGWGFDNPGTRY